MHVRAELVFGAFASEFPPCMAAEMSWSPGQTTPPNHISSGFVYLVLFALLLLPDLQTKVKQNSFPIRERVPDNVSIYTS